jgi:hypothetical protein
MDRVEIELSDAFPSKRVNCKGGIMDGPDELLALIYELDGYVRILESPAMNLSLLPSSDKIGQPFLMLLWPFL